MISETDSTRKTDLETFLKHCFSETIRDYVPVQGDAGFRSYFRIKINNRSYIVMDCPPTYCSIEPFIKIGNYLKSQNFSAPEIFHFDIKKGFIVLEDLGNFNIKTFIDTSPKSLHKNLYHLVVDTLVSLQEKPPINLTIYDNPLLLKELNLFLDWYIPYFLNRTLTKTELDEYQGIWKEILNNQIPLSNCLVLRDYHVENIMYLEKRQGIKKLGLLDFQDAVLGSPIYDLVSILEDARIEVSRDLAIDCIKYFAKQRRFDLEEVTTNYHILGAQRNSRILGVFARKYIRDQNDNYLKYIPLVLEYLNYDLSHPIMSKLKFWFTKVVINSNSL